MTEGVPYANKAMTDNLPPTENGQLKQCHRFAAERNAAGWLHHQQQCGVDAAVCV